LEPDTIEELVEAMKLLDISKDGTIQISELRFAMTKLGDAMDETSVDEMVKEIDPDGKGFVDIFEFAKIFDKFLISLLESKFFIIEFIDLLPKNIIVRKLTNDMNYKFIFGQILIVDDKFIKYNLLKNSELLLFDNNRILF
jgi:hypothetical protein